MTSSASSFATRHIGPSAQDQRAMLAALGIPSVETLITQAVPKSIRLDRPLDLPAPASEAEALGELSAIMGRNKVLKSFIGQGYHGCFVPPVIQRNLFENPAWYTAYTPYQAEISQGRLEMLFHFQTLITELTGLPIASASLLDEATAVAEAVGMAFRHHREKRTRVVLAGELHPQVLDVAKTRAEPLGMRIVEGKVDGETAALIVPWPDTFGVYRDHSAAIQRAKEVDALVIFVADPLDPAVGRRYRVDPGQSRASYAVEETFLFENNRLFTEVGVTRGIAGEILLDPADPAAARVGEIVVHVGQ
ncbi:MAG: hypothetical protein J0H60_12770, partial [Rhizobiales bacterium]|nr:hypothetical protein [Hyphomicrobiales bacterium]